MQVKNLNPVTTLFKIGGIQIRKIIIPARTIILKK